MVFACPESTSQTYEFLRILLNFMISMVALGDLLIYYAYPNQLFFDPVGAPEAWVSLVLRGTSQTYEFL